MSEPIVEIEQGKLKGSSGTDYHGGKFFKFLGIPYAKAPVGELRLKAPRPPDPWTGIKNATKEGPECPSADMYFTYFVGNEDNCLNLNIYTKELPKSNDSDLNKPVMVWIHGGAFVCGSNKPEIYGPDYLMTQDIVLVTINYRLGMLGFASFKDQSLGVPGNAGLKDQRMALKWVQNNIKHFGGDPGNVTIFGESAGAASVHYLTLSPTTKGLFHKAILQSGSALNSWAWGKNNSSEIAKYLGYKETTDEKTILERLTKEPAANIVSAQKKIKEFFSASKMRPWGPVVEPPSPDAILTEHPSKTMHTEGGHDIPMIIGYNSGEGIFFELVRKTAPGIGLPRNLEHEIPFELGFEKGEEKSKELADKLRKVYFDDDHCNEENIENVYQLKGDTNFLHSIQRTIKLQAKYSSQPVYAYRMSLMGPLNYFHTLAMAKSFKTAIFYIFLSKLSANYLPFAKSSVQGLLRNITKKEFNGVVHADDLGYLFPTFYTPKIIEGSPEDLYIQRFVKLWTNFARSGDPTPNLEEALDRAKWKPVNQDDLEFLDIGHELKMIENVDGERLKLWDEIYETHLKV